MNGCSFQQVLRLYLGWFLSYHWKTLCPRDFILKPTERAWVGLINNTKDFQNSPPFERSACFYATISGNFERFQYSDFLENENIFQENGVLFLVESIEIESALKDWNFERLKAHHFHTKLTYQRPMLRQIE